MSVVQHLIDLVLFIIVVAGPIPLCLSVLLVLEGKNGRPSFTHCLLMVLVGWCLVETCLAVVLGAIHHLDQSTVVLCEVSLFAIGLLVQKRSGGIISLVSLLRRREIGAPLSGWEKLIIGSIAVLMGILLLRITSIPTTNYDSLGYHLPIMADRYQTSSLSTPEEFRTGVGRYPSSWEGLGTLFMIPFREDFLVAFPNLVAWTILGLSVHVLGLHLAGKRIHCLAAASLCLMMPMVLEHVGTMHVDVPFASFFAAGLYFSVLYTSTKRMAYLAVFTAILGMLLGIKTSGAFYGGILIVFMASSAIRAHLLRKRSLQVAPRSKQRVGLLFLGGLLCFLIAGCYWYLKNFLEVGNPFGIVRINIGGVTLFPGPIDPAYIHKTTLAGLFGLTNLSHWKILIDQIFVNLGLPFLAILILFVSSLLLLPFKSARDRNEPRIKTKSVIGLLALLVLTVLLYWNTPYSGDNGTHDFQITPWIGQGLRYAFSTIGVLGILAALGATLARVKDQIIVSIVIACGVLAVLSTPNQRLASIFLYTVVGLLLVWSLLNAAGWARWIASVRGIPRLGVAFILIGVIFVVSFAARGIRDRYRNIEYHGILDYIENNIGKEQTIGYLLDHRPYLLYGKHFDRKVVYILPDETGARQGQLDSVAHSQWLDTLAKRKVSFVAVGPILDAWKAREELSWVRNDEKAFVHVFGQDTANETFIYRFMGHE